MNKLKMSSEDIRNLISLREQYWEYDFETNCYAFALGLDVPENDIVKNAYQLGVMGVISKDMPISMLKDLSLEERMMLDLDFLEIDCCEAEPCESSSFKFIYRKNNVIACDHIWTIALFNDRGSFHFMRKSYDGEWFHKKGYLAGPINFDSDRKIITDPRECNINGCQYVKTYRLSYREKY